MDDDDDIEELNVPRLEWVPGHEGVYIRRSSEPRILQFRHVGDRSAGLSEDTKSVEQFDTAEQAVRTTTEGSRNRFSNEPKVIQVRHVTREDPEQDEPKVVQVRYVTRGDSELDEP